MVLDLSLFDYADEIGIVLDHNVLSSEFVPPEIVGREDQKKEIAALMKPLFKNGAPDNALIFGPTGSGKTVVSKYVLKSLMAKLEQSPLKIKVQWVYLQGKEVNTNVAILYHLIKDIDPGSQVPPVGWSLDRYFDALYQLMNSMNVALVMVLDEIDALKADDVLYNFSRARSNEKLTEGRFISIIGLSNSLDFEDTLDQRILSSILFTRLRFPPYTPDDIFHILNDRVNLAFVPNSVDIPTLERCAIDAAQTEGDARRALNVLKTAAELAEKEGVNRITITHIISAEEKVQTDEIIGTVLELPIQHKLVLASVSKLMKFKCEAAETGEVTKLYGKMCKYLNQINRDEDTWVEVKPKDRTTVSKIIRSLELQSIIQFVTVNRGIKGGRTRLISITNDNIDKVEFGLYEDYKLEGLRDYHPEQVLGMV